MVLLILQNASQQHLPQENLDQLVQIVTNHKEL
jgi:hypothetical protein